MAFFYHSTTLLSELTVFRPYLSDMFPQREELVIIPIKTACFNENSDVCDVKKKKKIIIIQCQFLVAVSYGLTG